MTIRVGILTAPHIDYELREHTFVLHNVRIGIGFHWDQTEDEEFEGELEILHNADGTETAINIIDLESYISCVICSEMSADSPLELLKAHAVISRSWVLRNIGHTGHVEYDVCADDHCQRYNGIRRRSALALQAVEETKGEVLSFSPQDGLSAHSAVLQQPTFRWRSGLSAKRSSICDCRYHKCCGGRTEIYSTCWEDKDYPYLQSVECPYCNPSAEGSPSAQRSYSTAVLQGKARSYVNDYDRSTVNYHDWVVEYTQEELSAIVREKTGVDFGLITDLIPLHRGVSGRIDRLEIVGTKHREVIGKELRIRQALSKTTLYSSWFEIEKLAKFRLRGHGWGHGVGLCQIGAATMAQQGFTYHQILAHYYRNTEIAFFD